MVLIDPMTIKQKKFRALGLKKKSPMSGLSSTKKKSPMSGLSKMISDINLSMRASNKGVVDSLLAEIDDMGIEY